MKNSLTNFLKVAEAKQTSVFHWPNSPSKVKQPKQLEAQRIHWDNRSVFKNLKVVYKLKLLDSLKQSNAN